MLLPPWAASALATARVHSLGLQANRSTHMQPPLSPAMGEPITLQLFTAL